MGPDFASQQTRIAGNLKRVFQFKTSQTSDKTYITVSYKDTKSMRPDDREQSRRRLCLDLQRLARLLPLHHPLPEFLLPRHSRHEDQRREAGARQ